MEYGTPQTLSSSYGTLSFNVEGAGLGLPGCMFLLQGIAGNVYPTIRNPTEDRPQRDGGIQHPFFKGAKYIEMDGLVVAMTPSNRTTMDDHMRGVTDPLLREDGTYTWAVPTADYPTPGTNRSHTVRLFETVEILGSGDSAGPSAEPKTFHFVLIAYGVTGEDGFEGVV